MIWAVLMARRRGRGLPPVDGAATIWYTTSTYRTRWPSRAAGTMTSRTSRARLAKTFKEGGVISGTGSSDNMMVPSNRPHPNAAKLFVNWFLSQEGQTIMHTLSEQESDPTLRMDVTDFGTTRTDRPPGRGGGVVLLHRRSRVRVQADRSARLREGRIQRHPLKIRRREQAAAGLRA